MKRLDLIIFVALSIGMSTVAHGQTRVGSEFVVNSDAESSQGHPALTGNTAGDFVVTWTRQSYENSADVFGQRFEGPGTPVGKEFLINTYTTGTQHEVSVASSANGDFVVVWSGDREYGSFDIFGRRFASDGAPKGEEFQINSSTVAAHRQEPVVTMAESGGFAVVWADNSSEGSSGIFGRRFHSDGTPLGLDFQINTDTAGSQYQPTAASDPSGRFVVAWLTDSEEAFPGRIRLQRFDADGMPVGGEVAISGAASEDESDPAVAIDAEGQFVVVWGEYSNIFGQRGAFDGGLSGKPFQVNGNSDDAAVSPQVSMIPAGEFVVAWEALTDELYVEVSGQLFDRSGSRQGEEFRVNSFSPGDQGRPALAGSTGDGDFFTVVWSGQVDEEATELAILGQSFRRVESLIFADGFESGDTSAWAP